MSHQQLASLACKILGIGAIFFSLLFSQGLFYAFDGDLGVLVSNAAPFGLFLIAGIVLIAFSGPLGARMARTLDGPDPATVQIGSGFEVVAIGLIGIFDLTRSLPALLNQILWISTRSELEWAGRGGAWGEGLASNVLRVALGLWLVLGARGWANVLRKLRGAGLQTDERPWEEGKDAAP